MITTGINHSAESSHSNTADDGLIFQSSEIHLNPANTDSSTIWHFHWTDSGQHLKSAFAIRFRNRNNGSNFSTVLGNEHFLGSVNNRAKDSAGFSAKLSESGLHKYEKYTLYFAGQASRLPAMLGRLGRGKISEPDFHRQQHKGTR